MASMITGFWKTVTFYCKNHPEQPMELKQGAYSAYYGCSHEFDENNPCHNRLNLIDAEKALQKIMDNLTGANLMGDMPDLTNYKMSKNGVEYKVIKHDTFSDSISIMVDNQKIMMGQAKEL
ncbi:hypothetical protein [Ruminococcus albus]|uniref:Uncharacterized protein n=1 Tax=Ruminococcus albus (strain ATCC 27210 / DSM 20455 / JCM 14654 / NCDO 2250 / 7) TaxID=697329 RepID=E6UJC7_RUMA7|nr:hypothetical protein [Ruminococcus albus]ADU23773.1 hypothetical protein Rumal_3310 [Ruminococcus albus 7 = DSM 20455]